MIAYRLSNGKSPRPCAGEGEREWVHLWRPRSSRRRCVPGLPGIGCIPILADGGKRPLGRWKGSQPRQPTPRELRAWFAGPREVGQDVRSVFSTTTALEPGRASTRWTAAARALAGQDAA